MQTQQALSWTDASPLTAHLTTDREPFPYLDQSEHFVLNDGGRVVFRRDDFNKHAINKVLTGH